MTQKINELKEEIRVLNYEENQAIEMHDFEKASHLKVQRLIKEEERLKLLLAEPLTQKQSEIESEFDVNGNEGDY